MTSHGAGFWLSVRGVHSPFASSREWEDMAGKRGDKFDVNSAALKLDDGLLRKAKALYDTVFGAQSGGKSAGKRPAGNWYQPEQKKVIVVCVNVMFALDMSLLLVGQGWQQHQ